jgi:hypothetical protein
VSADPIVYCLEHLTDYPQFERLASDLMARDGYPDIEPLGGTADGGRDALHTCRVSGDQHVFAYSVRVDWDTKLRQDCARIAELELVPNTVVFVSTQTLPTSRKDALRAEIDAEYGWQVIFYDIERLRVLLTGPCVDLLERHPSIFCAPWFRRSGGVLTTHRQRDLIVIDHVPADRALAAWLYRKLSLEGFGIWCLGFAPLAGEDADASVRTLIQTRTACYLPILSTTALQDATYRSRWPLALASEDRTIPCWAAALDAEMLDAQMRALTPARFDRSWQIALATLLEVLTARGIPHTVGTETGRQLALAAYSPKPLLRDEPETVYANVFRVRAPEALSAYRLADEHAVLAPDLPARWAFARRGPTVFAFTPPPEDVPVERGQPHRYAWRAMREQYGQDSLNLVKELVRKSVEVACFNAEFRWCDERHTFYLDEAEQQRHSFQHVDGRWTWATLTGERAFGWGESKSRFRYQLGPRFRVGMDDTGQLWLTVRLYVRLTDTDGTPLDVRKIPSRRKVVTKSWWNKEWLARLLAVMQRLANQGSGTTAEIQIGESRHAVTVPTAPLSWECPVGIDVVALDQLATIQDELAALRDGRDNDEDADA